MKQLLLFYDVDSKHERDMQVLEGKYEKLRKGQHARITGLQKKVDYLEEQIEFLKSHICKQNLFSN